MIYIMYGGGNRHHKRMNTRDLEKAALRGEPSYIWRSGQERRLQMILDSAGERIKGTLLENGCGVGMYLQHLAPKAGKMVGLEFDFERATEAHTRAVNLINGASEALPFSDGAFDVILSHEVLEHVSDDRRSLEEMLRTLKPGGVIVLFVPNLGYPYETHGIYWHGRYHFGNIPFIHYLPAGLRKKLTPHVRAYSASDIQKLFDGLPVQVMKRQIIFGAYDNIIYRFPKFGLFLRTILQSMEKTPLKFFGLSHFWVVEKKLSRLHQFESQISRL